MPDDQKRKRGTPVRKEGPANEVIYSIKVFAKEQGITQDQARRLIRRFGKKRQKLEEEAKKLIKRGRAT